MQIDCSKLTVGVSAYGRSSAFPALIRPWTRLQQVEDVNEWMHGLMESKWRGGPREEAENNKTKPARQKNRWGVDREPPEELSYWCWKTNHTFLQVSAHKRAFIQVHAISGHWSDPVKPAPIFGLVFECPAPAEKYLLSWHQHTQENWLHLSWMQMHLYNIKMMKVSSALRRRKLLLMTSFSHFYGTKKEKETKQKTIKPALMVWKHHLALHGAS